MPVNGMDADGLSFAVSVGAFVAASAALIINAYYSWISVRASQRAEKAKHRETWCNDLRTELSSFLSEIAAIHDSHNPEKHCAKIRAAEASVQLRLNPPFRLVDVKKDRSGIYRDVEKGVEKNFFPEACPNWTTGWAAHETPVEKWGFRSCPLQNEEFFHDLLESNYPRPGNCCFANLQEQPIWGVDGNRRLKDFSDSKEKKMEVAHAFSEAFLPFCMHKMTRMVGIVETKDCHSSHPFQKEYECIEKPLSSKWKASWYKKKSKAKGERKSKEGIQFVTCYEGITAMGRNILKYEWERTKGEIDGSDDKRATQIGFPDFIALGVVLCVVTVLAAFAVFSFNRNQIQMAIVDLLSAEVITAALFSFLWKKRFKLSSLGHGVRFLIGAALVCFCAVVSLLIAGSLIVCDPIVLMLEEKYYASAALLVLVVCVSSLAFVALRESDEKCFFKNRGKKSEETGDYGSAE